MPPNPVKHAQVAVVVVVTAAAAVVDTAAVAAVAATVAATATSLPDARTLGKIRANLKGPFAPQERLST
jgi:hypothetical protein